MSDELIQEKDEYKELNHNFSKRDLIQMYIESKQQLAQRDGLLERAKPFVHDAMINASTDVAKGASQWLADYAALKKGGEK